MMPRHAGAWLRGTQRSAWQQVAGTQSMSFSQVAAAVGFAVGFAVAVVVGLAVGFAVAVGFPVVVGFVVGLVVAVAVGADERAHAVKSSATQMPRSIIMRDASRVARPRQSCAGTI